MKDGERCTVYYPNGERYRGEWSANKKEGKGTISYKNGNKYEGGFKKGQRHGQGTLWINEEEEGKFRVLYTGQWFEGRKQGYGVCVSKSGDRYEGEWLKVRARAWGHRNAFRRTQLLPQHRLLWMHAGSDNFMCAAVCPLGRA